MTPGRTRSPSHQLSPPPRYERAMEETSVFDVSMQEKYWRRKYVEDQEGPLYGESWGGFPADILPEDIMGKIQEHLGDGNATVSVGADLADSIEYGNKAGAFFSVTVKCNNDESDIGEVHDHLSEYVRYTIEADLEEVKKIRNASMGIAPAPVNSAPAGKKVPPTTARPNKKSAAPKGVKRPNLRR